MKQDPSQESVLQLLSDHDSLRTTDFEKHLNHAHRHEGLLLNLLDNGFAAEPKPHLWQISPAGRLRLQELITARQAAEEKAANRRTQGQMFA